MKRQRLFVLAVLCLGLFAASPAYAQQEPSPSLVQMAREVDPQRWSGQRNGAPRRAPRSICSVPVWPSGDWLPFRYIERATQVHGWFGLAPHRFPVLRMPKHEFLSV